MEHRPTRPAARVPTNTYRLQLNAGFTFDDARHTLPLLDRLGVTDHYLSPCLPVSPLARAAVMATTSAITLD